MELVNYYYIAHLLPTGNSERVHDKRAPGDIPPKNHILPGPVHTVCEGHEVPSKTFQPGRRIVQGMSHY